MAFPKPPTTSKETDQEPQSVLYFLIFLLFVIQLLWFMKGPFPLADGAIVDSDGYMHLNRVLHLVETGDWFSSVYPRSNAPYGDVQHWTRVIDIILLGGAGLASLVIPFSRALHWWGVLVSPVLQVLTVVALVWMVRPIFNRDHQLLIGGVFLLQPALTHSFLAGRPDHHSFLMLCFVLLLGITFRMTFHPHYKKWCIGAGALGGIAIWTSVESLVALSVCLGVMALGWVWNGGNWGRRNFLLTSTLCGVSLLALLLERGYWQFFQAEYDRFSFVHWSVLSLVACFWIIVWLREGRSESESTPRQRLGLGVGGLVVILGIQWGLFPKFFHGPLVDVDPQMMTLLWNRVAETQPLVSTDPWQFGRLIFNLGIALPAVPYLIWLLWHESNEKNRLFWAMIGIGLLLFIPLAFNEIRWVPYAELLLLMPYTRLMGRLLQRFADPLNSPWNGVVKMALVLVSAMWFLLVGAKILEVEQSAIAGTTPQDCPIIPLSEYLNNSNGWGSRERTILAFVDFGPELLYRTPSSSYHDSLSSKYGRYFGCPSDYVRFYRCDCQKFTEDPSC